MHLPFSAAKSAAKVKCQHTLVSNKLGATAQEIADTYKARRQIELLFKWLKQHLQLKRFLGRSVNAVKLQILCAMIAYLLLKLYRQSGRMGESLHLLCARIAGSLFERPQTLYAHYARRRRERLELARMQGCCFEVKCLVC